MLPLGAPALCGTRRSAGGRTHGEPSGSASSASRTVSHPQFLESLDDRIARGEELRARELHSEPELALARQGYHSWDEFNATLMRRSSPMRPRMAGSQRLPVHKALPFGLLGRQAGRGSTLWIAGRSADLPSVRDGGFERQYSTTSGTVLPLSTQYCLRYATAITSELDAPGVSPATQAALAAVAEQAIGPELERIRAQLDATLAQMIAEATKGLRDHLAATMAPLLEEVARTSGFQETIAEAMREFALHAGVLEAKDNSGYRSALYGLAAEHHGFVTTEMARAVGVPSVEVRKLAARGGMSNVARGLYRVEGIDAGDRAPYAEAVLRVGEDAHLVGDSVLAFHDLALVNPRRIKVATPRRVRKDLPSHIQLVHARTDPADLTEYDGIPSLTVAAAIRDSIGALIPERLSAAVERAADEGLVRRREATALLAEIRAAA